MRSLMLFAFASIASTTGALAAGGTHAGGGAGFHGGAAMSAAPRWSGTPTIPLNAPGARPAAMPNGGGGGGGGGWGHGGWHGGMGGPGGPGGPGGWHPGGGHGGWHGGWHRPGPPGNWGGRHFRLIRGSRLPIFFLGGSFFVQDWWDYGLSQPPYGSNWVRYYDDAMLVDGDGTVSDARYGLDWDSAGGGYGEEGEGPDFAHAISGTPKAGAPGGDPAYAAGYDDGYDDGFADGEDKVTWGGRWHGGPGPRGGYVDGGARVFRGAGGSTVVVVQSPATVTTTTTTTEEVSYAPRRVWRGKYQPRHVWRRPVCRCR